MSAYQRALGAILSTAVVGAGAVAVTTAPAAAAQAPVVTARTATLTTSTASTGEEGRLLGLLTALQPPSLTGAPELGSLLEVVRPVWNLLTVSESVQWLRDGVPVPGATSWSFVPRLEDAGSTLQAVVTGSVLGLLPVQTFTNALPIPLLDGGGTGGGTGGDDPFEAVKLPGISGIPGVGSLLVILDPVWSLPGVSMAYQWFADGVPVPGATEPFIVPVAELGGKELFARVTGTLAGLPVVSTVTTALPIPAAPPAELTASSAPSLAGTPQVGKPLAVTDPTWEQDGVTHTYQWLRDGTPIAGATAATHLLTAADFGHAVSAKVTGAKEGHTSQTLDTPARAVELGDAPSFTVQPTVAGTPAPGERLVARPGSWGAGDTPTFGYQWLRDGAAVPGATGATYDVSVRDVGGALSLQLTATRPAHRPATFRTSALTVPKIATRTTARLTSAKVRQGVRSALVVRVRASGVRPAGKVLVRVDGRRVKSVRVDGRRKVRLPVLRPGRHRVQAVYAGSATTARSVSRKVVLTVVRRRR